MAPYWPVVLKQDNLTLRPLKYSDKFSWGKIRDHNASR
jgi:hypothetical protein